MKKLRMSVNLKVILGIAAIMVCVGVVGLSVFGATEKKSLADARSIHTYQMISLMKEMRLDLANMSDYEHSYSMNGNNKDSILYAESVDKLSNTFNSLSEWTEDEVGKLKVLADKIPGALNKMKMVKNDDGNEEMAYEDSGVVGQIEKLDSLIKTMISSGEEELVENKIEADKKQRELIWWIVFGTILCSSMALMTAMTVVFMVTKPLVRLTGVIDDISKGDLSTAIDKKILNKNDEVGDLARSFDRTMVSLKLAMKKSKEE